MAAAEEEEVVVVVEEEEEEVVVVEEEEEEEARPPSPLRVWLSASVGRPPVVTLIALPPGSHCPLPDRIATAGFARQPR